MRGKEELIARLTDPGVIGIIRTRDAAHVLPIFESLIAGGFTAVEVTLTTPDALVSIREARKLAGGRAVIGAGTVVDSEDCRKALDAGAEFIVSPICDAGVAQVANAAAKPVMLGAYTPTEAQQTWRVGADFVKLFPADTLGPKYIKALLAPLPHLRCVPTGGVNLKNLAEFFKAGSAAVGVGSSLLSAQILDRKDWPQLTRLASEFVAAARQARVK